MITLTADLGQVSEEVEVTKRRAIFFTPEQVDEILREYAIRRLAVRPSFRSEVRVEWDQNAMGRSGHVRVSITYRAETDPTTDALAENRTASVPAPEGHD